MVAREMSRARGPDGHHLFQTTEFLVASQVASFFSRQSAALLHACEEEINFTQAKEAVETIQLQQPLVYDQYDLCAMAMEGNLKNLKLPMLQHVCENLGLDVPNPPIRRKAPYLVLLEDITNKCTCRK